MAFKGLNPNVLVQVATVDSTNDEAFRLLSDREEVLVWTTDQRRGRGSRGRQWLSPSGAGLALSLGIQAPPHPHPARFCYPLFAGLWLHQALCQVFPQAEFQLKWPNDLLLAGRKLAGILCESRLEGERAKIVVGIGLNLRDDATLTTLDRTYATLAELPFPTTPETLLSHLISGFAPLLERTQHVRLADLWLPHSAFKPGQLLQITYDGKSFRGSFEGLSDDGGMRVRREDGVPLILSQAVEECLILKEGSCS